MSLGLCIECGAFRAPTPRRAPCHACGAAAPEWKRVPLTAAGLAHRLGVGLLLAAVGLFLAALVMTLCSRWLGPPEPERMFQLVLLAITVIGGGVAALVLVRLAMEKVFYLDYRHDQAEGDRRGEAHVVSGRVGAAAGRATRDAGVFAPGTPGLAGLPVFVNMGVFAPEIGRAMRAPYPKGADVAVLASLLGLASRGRCELVLRLTRTWTRRPGERVRKGPDRFTVRVRRIAARGALPPEQGWLENALLAALEAVSTAPGQTSIRAVRGEGPYRSTATALAAEQRDAPVPIDVLLGAFTGGRLEARRWLHSVLRGEAKALGYDERRAAAERLRPELTAVLALQRHSSGHSPAAALLLEIKEGLALGGRAS